MWLITRKNTSLARRLSDALGARRLPSRSWHMAQWPRDFFLNYPELRHEQAAYTTLRGFISQNKAQQRARLAQEGELPTPRTRSNFSPDPASSTLGWVVRPLRHSKGEGYRLTNQPNDFRPGEEYISDVFPKTLEYRLIFCRGQFVVACRKMPAEGMDQRSAWNLDAGAEFEQRKNPKLPPGTIERIAACPFVAPASLCGVDVMVDKHGKWVVLECNYRPNLGPFNLARVVKICQGAH